MRSRFRASAGRRSVDEQQEDAVMRRALGKPVPPQARATTQPRANLTHAIRNS